MNCQDLFAFRHLRYEGSMAQIVRGNWGTTELGLLIASDNHEFKLRSALSLLPPLCALQLLHVFCTKLVVRCATLAAFTYTSHSACSCFVRVQVRPIAGG